MKKTALMLIGLMTIFANVSLASVCPDIQYIEQYQLSTGADVSRIASDAAGIIYVADLTAGFLKVYDSAYNNIDSTESRFQLGSALVVLQQ